MLKHNQEDETDYADLTNTFYTTYFEKPDDDITDKFNEIIQTDFYIYHLPISFIDGLPMLEERKHLTLKTVPLFSELIKGTYETKKSKYDQTNVRVNIEFFTNNLPSFTQYANQEKLDWVITHHRLLSLEIFDYYKDQSPSLSTLEHRFNAILRMIRIAYGNKTSPLYKLFSIIVFQIHEFIIEYEGENMLNAHEQKKYVNWEDVLAIQKELEDEFESIKEKDDRKAYDLNNDLLLISMYSLIPPLRNEVKSLEFKTDAENTKDDYIYISPTKIILKLNKVKKMHGKVQFDLTTGKYRCDHLANIIRKSYELYPRQFLFTHKHKYPENVKQATKRALDNRLISIFFHRGISNQISVNSLRSSYVSYRLSDPDLSFNQKKLIVKQMRTSILCLESSYKKIIRKPPVLVKVETVHNDKVDVGVNTSLPPKSEEEKQLNQYQKKLKREKEYYQENKEKMLEYQKKYNDKKTPFEKSRARLLQLLNASEEYAAKMRDTTREKYKFVYDEAKKRWKWQD